MVTWPEKGDIGQQEIIRQYLFEDGNGRPVTAVTDWYLALMRNKFNQALRRKQGVNLDIVTFQQDGAPTKKRWNTFITTHWLFWLPFSPDLSLQDFVIWGYLNKTIYANNLEALKTNISREVKNIPVDMIARVIANFIIWEAAVIQKQGAWKEHTINY